MEAIVSEERNKIAGVGERIQQWVARTMGMDLRVLPWLRYGLALMLCIDAGFYWHSIGLLYASDGVLPANMWEAFNESKGQWTLLLYLPDSWLWVAGAVQVLLALLIARGGGKTWLWILLAWLSVLNIQHRCWISWQGCDVLLRNVLFWSIFLPYHAEKLKNKMQWVSTLGTAAFKIQIISVYLFTAILKSSEQWWPLGNASSLAFQLDNFNLPLSRYLLQYPELLRISTLGILVLEWSIPALLLFTKGKARWIALGVLVLLQVMFALTIRVGPFPYYNIICLIPFIPIRKGATQWMIDHNGESWMHRIVYGVRQVVVAIAAGIVLTYNLSSIPAYPMKVPNELDPLGYATGWVQSWTMFSPRPPNFEVFTAVVGVTADSQKVAIRSHSTKYPLETMDRAVASNVFSSYREQKMLERINSKDRMLTVPYLLYAARNPMHGEELNGLKIIELQLYQCEDSSLIERDIDGKVKGNKPVVPLEWKKMSAINKSYAKDGKKYWILGKED